MNRIRSIDQSRVADRLRTLHVLGIARRRANYRGIDTKALRAGFKENVNSMDIDRKTKDLIIEEKKLVFKMNNEIASQVAISAKGFSRLIKLFLMAVLIIILFVIAIKMIL